MAAPVPTSAPNELTMDVDSDINRAPLTAASTECTICHEPYGSTNVVVGTRCNHYFHLNCLCNWAMKIYHQILCPSCSTILGQHALGSQQPLLPRPQEDGPVIASPSVPDPRQQFTLALRPRKERLDPPQREPTAQFALALRPRESLPVAPSIRGRRQYREDIQAIRIDLNRHMLESRDMSLQSLEWRLTSLRKGIARMRRNIDNERGYIARLSLRGRPVKLEWQAQLASIERRLADILS